MLPLDCRATHVAFRLDGHNDGFMTELVSLTALGSDQYYLKAVGAAPQAQSAHPDGLLLGVRFSERMEAGLEVRVLHVAPLQVAVNATRRILALRPGWRSDSESRMLELAPGGRAALHWRGGQELLVQARISDLTGSWSRWSGRLPVGSVGEYSFQSCWEKMSEVVFENFRVEVRNVEATTYFVFREAGKSAPILLRNFSVEPLLFQQELPHDRFGEDSEDGDKRQRWFRASSFTSSSHSTPEVAVNRRGLKLEPGQTRPFAWAEPLGSAKRLEVRSFLTPVMTRLTLEKTEKSLPLDISKHPLFYDVVTSGSSLVMTVRDRPRPEAFPALSEDRELQVNVNLAGLGLSLVAPTSCAFPEAQDNSDEVLRRELLNCSVEKIVGAFRRHDLIETLELSLQEVQVDNQREDASHPVLLKRRGEGKEDALPLLQLVLSRYCDAERPQLLHFDRLEVKLRSIDLRLDQGFIFDVMALATSIRSSLGVSTDSTADRNGDDLGLEKEGLKLHFNRLELGSAKVRVSFAGSSWGSAPGDVAFWKRLLSSLSSVDRAVLRFDEYTLQETTADAENFVTTLRGHYVKQFWRELKWFVGRLEVLGTPVTFCGSVARSCKEGALAPYKGATRSPEDMLEGCLLGTGGCVRNALFECFNSLSKATGAASQGCRICLPEDFQNPPTRGGLKTACDSCMGTMCHSVTGLCTRPVRGCRRGGLRGCASGATEGLFGCAGGIIVGCLDMTRQTTERLRNAASRTEQGRRRLPRALYGVERALRPFDQRDAELKAHFVASDPSLASMALLETVRDENGLVAAVSDLHFLYYSRDGHLTKVPLEDIMEVEVSDKAIVLQRAGLGELRLDDGAPERLRRAGRLLGECLAV
ncbi:unnamed protein product [Durusdinium trenchii]|uniref:Vacuolar protein sorting-associated protein 13 VPS13 adaptor binding domain-containing protein n=2 Tax=Durusdinium trenchii TaxID=1381693 RepID=A0ABP0M649_9DINO